MTDIKRDPKAWNVLWNGRIIGGIDTMDPTRNEILDFDDQQRAEILADAIVAQMEAYGFGEDGRRMVTIDHPIAPKDDQPPA